MVSAAAAADPPEYGRARAVASYDGVMRSLIHAFKYYDRHDARRLFGRWLAEAGHELLADPSAVLVPVPLSRWRLIGRRFNQAAILVQEIARLTGHPVALQALNRVRHVKRQVGLTREQRRANVRGAFLVPHGRRPLIVGQRIVLVDDVITTGATARACTRALLRGGARSVDVLALGLVTDASHVTL